MSKYFLIGDNIPINNEMAVIDFINIKIEPTESFKDPTRVNKTTHSFRYYRRGRFR
jgi:hypothetical protein